MRGLADGTIPATDYTTLFKYLPKFKITPWLDCFEEHINYEGISLGFYTVLALPNQLDSENVCVLGAAHPSA